MPIYVYHCETCGAQFEQMQAFSDTSIPACPEGHTAVRRLFSPPAIHFKGSGWYITDSRKNNHKPNGKASSESEKKEAESAKKED